MGIIACDIPPEQKISRMIRQLERERRKYMDSCLHEHDIQGDMYLFLLALSHFPGTSQDFLAEYLTLDKSNTARVARRLEDSGYIVRTQVQNNRRQYSIVLTGSGEKSVVAIRRALKDWQDIVMARLSDEEKQQLVAQLSGMLEESGKALSDN